MGWRNTVGIEALCGEPTERQCKSRSSGVFFFGIDELKILEEVASRGTS
jgi:hypothetical protein